MKLDGLSNRARKRLEAADLTTPEEVFRCTDPELLRMPGLGSGTLKEIKKWLTNFPNPLEGLGNRATAALKQQEIYSKEQAMRLPTEHLVPSSWWNTEDLVQEIEDWRSRK